MKNEYDLLIRRFLLDAAKKDFDEALANVQVEHAFSPKYLSWEDLFLQHPVEMAKRTFRSPQQRILRLIACVTLILFFSFGSVLIVSPTVRAAVIDWLQLTEQPTITHIDLHLHLGGPTGNVYTSEHFACVEENGNYLRYRFFNNGTDPCTLQLYKVHFPHDQNAGEPITVEPDKEETGLFENPRNGVFYLRVTCTSGIGSELIGILQADQIDMSER